MHGNNTGKSGQWSGRRERATRGAFCLWVATYVVVVAAIVTVHGIGGTTAPDTDPSHHATRAGTSLAPLVAQADVDG